MSVVAVKVYDDKISIGADSIRVYEYTQEKEPTAKLLEVNNMVIGHSGKCIDLFLLASFAKTRKPKEKQTKMIY